MSVSPTPPRPEPAAWAAEDYDRVLTELQSVLHQAAGEGIVPRFDLLRAVGAIIEQHPSAAAGADVDAAAAELPADTPRWMVEKALRKAYKLPHPAAPVVPVVTEDARDAARYRWLKQNGSSSTLCAMAYRVPAAREFTTPDECIDAALTAASEVRG